MSSRTPERLFKFIGLALIITLLSMMSVGNVLAAPTCTTDCYVDPGGDDAANSGESGSPLKTIQAAIDAVDPGGTVHVAAGTYAENVTVDKVLTLDGAGKGVTIIEPSSPGITILTGGTSSVDRVVVSNLTVQGASGGGNTGSGILIQAGDATIEHLTFDSIESINNGGHGIGINHTGTVGDIIVTDSTLSGNGGSGFRIPSGIGSFDGLVINDGMIENNGVSGLNINPNATYPVAIDNITVDGTTFSNNVTSSSVNQSDLSLLFEGTLTLKNINVTTSSKASYAIQVRGDGDLVGAPTVTLENVVISGSPKKTGLQLHEFFDVSNFSMSGVDLSGVTGAGWYPMALGHTGAPPLDMGDTILPVAGIPTTLSMWGTGGADATGVTWVGAADNFDIEDHVGHAIDTGIALRGYVEWVPNNAYVTVNSFDGALTTEPSIQRAIDAVASGDTINIGPGVFEENFVVNKHVKLIGQGNGTTASDTILRKDVNLRIVQLAASGVSAADPLLIKDLRIEPAHVIGIEVHNNVSVSYVKIENVNVVGTNPTNDIEGEIGFKIATTGDVSYLEIVNSTFDNLAYGWYFAKGDWAPGGSNVQYVTMTGGSFSNNDAKGIYIEKLSDATFTGVTVHNNGIDSAFWNSTWNAGFDINLKGQETYQNLSFINMTVTDNGLNVAEGAGFMIKARDDGAYAGSPASLNNVLIQGGTFEGNERGIRFGEPGKDNAGPTNVLVDGVTIKDNVPQYVGGSATGGVINMTQESITVVNSDITGNGDFGATNNGSGDIMAVYNWWDAADGPSDQGPGSGDAVSTGVYFCPWLDDVVGVGSPVSGGGIVTNLDTGEVFCTIQAAIDDSDTDNGDIIDISAGVFTGPGNEQVHVYKSVTLQGQGMGTTTVLGADNLPLNFVTSNTNVPVIYVTAEGVTIRDLTVDGDGKGNTNYRYIGIAYYNAAGLIDGVEVKGIQDTPFSGNQAGIGILVVADDNAVREMTISGSTISEYQKNGITVDGNGLSATISGNTVTGVGPSTVIAQNGIQVSRGASAEIFGNTLSGHSWTLNDNWTSTNILLYSAADAEVYNNIITEGQVGVYHIDSPVNIHDNTISATQAGVGQNDFYGIISFSNNSAVSITGNSVTTDGPTTENIGIYVLGGYSGTALSATVNANTVSNWSYGAYIGCYGNCPVDGGSSVTVTKNYFTDNTEGVFVDTLPDVVSINRNSITGNSAFGVSNYDSGSDLDAECNWWGAVDGPSGAGSGSGDPVDTDTDFMPWLISDDLDGACDGGKPVTIRARKYEDLNANHQKDGGEPYLENWTMTLYDAQGNEVQSGVTNGSGWFVFDQVEAGTYTVCETLQNGWVNTGSMFNGSDISNANFGDEPCYTHTYSYNQDWTWLFGNIEKLDLWVEKYEDMDGDGNPPNLPPENDPRADADFDFTVYDASDQIVASGTTNAGNNGKVYFGKFLPGTYTVCEAVTSGWINTFAGPATPVTDPEGLGRVCVAKTLGSGQDWTFVFGNSALARIRVEKYEDLNGNGVHNFGPNAEPGIKDWEFELYDADMNYMVTLDTGPNGWVTFNNLEPGEYTVCEVAQDYWMNTDPGNGLCETVVVTSGWGYAGQEWLRFGNYKLAEVTIVKETNPVDANWLNFGFKMNGEPFYLNGGIDPQTNSTTFTLEPGEHGIFEFDKPSNWDLTSVVCESDDIPYQIEETGVGFLTPSDHSGASMTCTFTNERRPQIKITKYDDLNGNGVWDDGEPTIEDWQMFLYESDGNGGWTQIQPREVRTDGNGVANYTNLEPGVDLLVCEEDVDGWINTDPGDDAILWDGHICQIVENPVYGEVRPVVFGNYEEASITIVKDAVPDSGVNFVFEGSFGVFKLDDDDDPTFPNSLSFGKLEPGEYTVTEKPKNNWYLTDIQCFAEDQSEVDADIDLENGTVVVSPTSGQHVTCVFTNEQGGRVTVRKYEDLNENGSRNGNEPWLAGWEFTLYDSGENVVDTKVTNNNGALTFGGLDEGTYTVCETDARLSDGWVNSEPGTEEPCYEVEVVFGEKTVVRFGNYALPGSIKVIKDVVWGENGADEAQEFELCVEDDCQTVGYNGGEVIFTDLPYGEYTVSETDPGEDWIVDGEGVVVVYPGQQSEITITNTDDRPFCSELDPDADLRNALTYIEDPDGSLWVVGQVTNSSDACSYDVGMASYKMYENSLLSQDLIDYELGTVGPNETIYFEVEICPCAAQVDLFYGDLIEQFVPGLLYGDRLLDALYVKWGEWCENDEKPVEEPGDNGQQEPPVDETPDPETMTVTVEKIVVWGESEPDTSETFDICLIGPSYPEADCQTIGYNGGVLTWTDLEVGEYDAFEQPEGDEWNVDGWGAGDSFFIENTYIAPEDPVDDTGNTGDMDGMEPDDNGQPQDNGDNGGPTDNGNDGQPQNPPECTDPNPARDLKHGGSHLTGDSSGVIVNLSDACSYTVGMASYQMVDNTTDNQILFDSRSAQIGPGETLNLSVSLPGCATQVDLFYGPVLQSLFHQRYGDRLIDGRYLSWGNWCGIDPQ